MNKSFVVVLFLISAGLAARDRYIVQIPTDPVFHATIIISNTSFQNLGALLEGRDNTGALVSTVDHIVVPPRQSRSFDSRELLGDNAASVFIPDVLNDPRLLFTVFYTHDIHTGQAHSAAKWETAATWRFYYDEQSNVFDGATILNPGDIPMDMTLSQVSENGQVLAESNISQISPKGKFTLLFDTFFTHVAGAHYQISTSEPSIAYGMRGVPGKSLAYENRAISHTPATGPGTITKIFDSSINTDQLIVANTGGTQRFFTITGYDASGNAHTPLISNLAPFETRVFDPVATLGPDRDYLIADVDADVKVTVANHHEQQTPLVHDTMETGEPWPFWRVQPGDQSQVDFVTMLNTSDQNISVRIRHFDAGGQLLEQSDTFEGLAPGVRFAWVDQFDHVPGSWLEVHGSQPFLLSTGRISNTGIISHGVGYRDEGFCDLRGAVPLWNQQVFIQDLVAISSFCPQPAK